MVRDVRLRLITGKGGVGKTTVATALALRESQRGRRVLLAEVAGGDRVAALLGAEPIGSQLREVRENLFVVNMDPIAAMQEYAQLTLRFETLYRAVFERQAVRRFLRMLPALGELVMLGKLGFHEQDQEQPFDLIVVDAPATGHALALLRTPRDMLRIVPRGPLHDHAQEILELLQDGNRTCVHIVTTPEEMPVHEAQRLAEGLQQLKIRVGPAVINHAPAPLGSGAVSLLQGLETRPGMEGLVQALKRYHHRQTAGAAELAQWHGPWVDSAARLPTVYHDALDDQVLGQFGRALGSLAAGSPQEVH